MAATIDRCELPVAGMDCADCAAKVERVLGRLDGVEQAHVSLSAERATVVFHPGRVSVAAMTRAIEALGYKVPSRPGLRAAPRTSEIISGLFVVAIAAVVMFGLLAERLGLVDGASRLVPAPVAIAAVLLGGFPIFRRVALALRARTVTPHALMTLGIIGALTIGEYGAAAVIVFFMRFADFLDGYAAGRARQALKELVALQPLEARVIRDGVEVEVAAEDLRFGETVLVKPGERIPVDGTVLWGRASVNQAPITGESVPVDREAGQTVLAATVNLDGVLRVRADHVGSDSTFGRIVRLVEEAESYKSRAQRFADRVTAYYIPVVAAAAAMAWLIRGSTTAAVAVLVVSCSCGIALATPVAVVAAVGRAARRGVLIKGGTALEALARADVLLLDKTGTLTLGQPHVTGVYPAGGRSPEDVLGIAASAERYSEHPIAAAIVAAARPIAGGSDAAGVAEVEVSSGRGVVMRDGAERVIVGSRRLIAEQGLEVPHILDDQGRALETRGQTAVFVAQAGTVFGVIAVADAPRPGVADALAALRTLGIRQITMLTGDNARVAQDIAERLGVDYQAELLPEDKIRIVRRLQAEGHTVAMVGDGINDAPALAQADAGIAMGTATAAALEAADVALLKDDWRLVPEAVRMSRRAFGVIRQNLLGTLAYNVIGITLATLGWLPPVLAAAAQVIPDFLILMNSGRLLRVAARPDR